MPPVARRLADDARRLDRASRRSRRCSRVRRGSSAGWRWRRPVRVDRRAVRTRPRDRPRDARGRADRADRRAPAARRAARDGVGDVLRRAGLRPGTPPSCRRAPSVRRRRRARAAQRRLRGQASGSATACSSPAGRARRCSPGWPPRSTPTATTELHRALDAVVDIAIDRHAKLSERGGRRDRARREPLRQGRDPHRPGRPRHERRIAARPDRRDRPRGRLRRPRTPTATTRSSSPPTR